MWQYYGLIALDLARERAREAQEAARRGRLARDAEEAGTASSGQVRRLVAAPVRVFSNITHAIADAACTAATRIEGRTA